MKKTVYHPPAAVLPPGFKFPQAYLDYVRQKDCPRMDPWFFLCFDQELYDWWLQTLKEQFPARQLVPFAKWALNDDIACFEPSEDPELPSIHYIHSFCDAGYEERGYCATFEEWIAVSLEESAAFMKDFPDGFQEYGYDDDDDDDDYDDDDDDNDDDSNDDDSNNDKKTV